MPGTTTTCADLSAGCGSVLGVARHHRAGPPLVVAAELGVDHSLGKPYSEEDLLALIGRYTPGYRLDLVTVDEVYAACAEVLSE